MDPKDQRATMDDVTDDLIITGARDAAVKAGEGDKIPKRYAVDPEEVAAGEEDDPEEEKVELGEDGKPKPKDPEDDPNDKPFIPEDPKDDEPATPAEPAAPPAKAAGEKGNPALDDDELKAYEQELKDAGFEDDSIKMMLKAVQLGGQMALKRLEKQRTDKEAELEASNAEADKQFKVRRIKQYQTIGTLQQEGILPKVPSAIQKKIVAGEQLTEKEAEHPGVKRQTEVWTHMSKQNQAAAARGEEPYLLTFRAALSDLEAGEARAAKSAKNNEETDKRKKQSSLLKGGGGGGGSDTPGAKGGKPKYVSGTSLDDVAAEILAELAAA